METNYKSKIQLQIALEKLALTPDQKKIFDDEIMPLFEELDRETREKILEKGENIGYREGYSEGFDDGHAEGYEEGYEDGKDN